MCFAFLLPPILVAMLSLDVSLRVCLLLSLLCPAFPAESSAHVVLLLYRILLLLCTCSKVTLRPVTCTTNPGLDFLVAGHPARIGVEVDLCSILVRNGCWHYDVVQARGYSPHLCVGFLLLALHPPPPPPSPPSSPLTLLTLIPLTLTPLTLTPLTLTPLTLTALTLTPLSHLSLSHLSRSHLSHSRLSLTLTPLALTPLTLTRVLSLALLVALVIPVVAGRRGVRARVGL